MENYLEALRAQRMLLLEKTRHLSTPQYNSIPAGHNNNIIWNMGHTLLVTEAYLYRAAPFEAPVQEFDSAVFRRGTRPDRALSDLGIGLIRKALNDTAAVYKEQLKDSGLREKIALSDEAFQFVLFHESIHYRTISALLNAI